MMDNRNRTYKRVLNDIANNDTKTEVLHNLLEESAREAYSRPWHRLERGLRLNRLRIFIENVSIHHMLSPTEKESLFLFLQKTHDKKLLNTTKIVHYNTETQRIELIRGLEIRRHPDGTIAWGFSEKKMKLDNTRKRRKKEHVPPTDTSEKL